MTDDKKLKQLEQTLEYNKDLDIIENQKDIDIIENQKDIDIVAMFYHVLCDRMSKKDKGGE